jgi:2-polyprenyl-6-methoxyphenol hydroxylase-like FAD-dependent oxidoreductase
LRILIVGAGMIGLSTAMLLARDGHEVNVVERDPAEPPDPSDAWDAWERRGVNQARLAHLFLSRFRSVIESELPDLAANLASAGACRYNILANIPDEMKGGTRAEDEQFGLISGRRMMVESVTARTAAETPGVTVRRGYAISGLVTGEAARDGVPNVTGLRSDSGEELLADLVVDAGGRRSALPTWLSDAGAAPCKEELDDSGFMYYGRHFRSADGSLPVMIGPLKQDYGSISVLTLPADNGTWSVTVITSSKDAALRRLRDPETWAAAVRMLPLAAHWLDGTPIDDGVTTMAKIEDRIRDFAPGGSPVATGVLPVADSWACTNPSLGRGVSIGVVHAVALRDLLRSEAVNDPATLALQWAELTRTAVEPWYRSTLHYDRHRLNEVQAIIDGRPYEPDDDQWRFTKMLELASAVDGDVLRAFISVAMVLRLPDELYDDRAFAERVRSLAQPMVGAPDLGPSRSDLLATVSA